MATKFKDSKNREWVLNLTIGRAKSVLDELGIDLLQPESEAASLPSLLVDDLRVAEILLVLLRGQFESHKISPENMLDDDWDGATSAAAYNALLEELIHFFTERGQSARAQIVETVRDTVVETMRQIEERIKTIDLVAEVAKTIESEVDGSTSGKQQAVSESTQEG